MRRTGHLLRAALGLALAAAALAAPQAAAQRIGGPGNPMGVWLERVHAPRYAPGALFQVAVTVNAAGEGTVNAMGLRETVPPGWTLAAVEAAIGDPPDISSPVGASGTLEFAWITPPALPHTFAYTLAVPEGESGPKRIHGALEYRTTGGALFASPVITETEGPAALAPVITLRGDNPATLAVGDAWEDPGYMAVDAGNQDITAKVVVSGAVDTATPGAYEVVYEVPAEGETPAARKVRAVNVRAADDPVDTAAPGTVIAPPGDPRETSNAIAATTEANPLNTPAKAPVPVAPPPPGFRRPHLPDVSALRPDLTPPGGETAADPAPAGPAAAETAPPGAPSGTDPAASATTASATAVSGQTPVETPPPAPPPAPAETAAPPAPDASVNPRVAALAAGAVLGLLAAALLAARQVYGGGRRRPH
ncbi:MAG: DUF5011 domain-containing protein [Candidatus Hydrogenedentes bacterium]|mgnify:CR=1 FL=1|nr:DUF5011 domain-containing protein [Candidatus Hydrogenedentota bacterium]